MTKRLGYDEVKKFVEENSDCKLLSIEYKNIDSKLKFKCVCGSEFETTFYKFKSRNKRSCNKCGRHRLAESKKLPYEQVKQFIEVESNSNCKLLSKEYKNAQEKLEIQCECGSIFWTKFNHFKDSFQRQCPQCGYERTAISKRLSQDHVRKYIESYGCKLLGEYKNTDTNIRIQCKCGNEFDTLFVMFRDYDIHSCKICREKEKSNSKGEVKIEKWLIANNINYKLQYTFDDCKHEKKLRFDFAILNKDNKVKLLIEYDGKQHFGLGLFSSNQEEMKIQYNKVRNSDFTKTEYCFKKSIPLLRIQFNKYTHIENILYNVLTI